ncbi:isoprenylcysteine carboxyl methyltransferase family protein [Brevundimonas variabilis]|uniref:Methyltransferase n=1 Tax=Brevundimonas variabilis TaxID=74312 RepID=A0A7W9CL62_9CAUL|nr:isoprenylcysteine carboxylmethyltransferase family protein [Brevundimonas variabilis]MBB5747624.1 methyltransferase [Brevundimonas variabilis]
MIASVVILILVTVQRLGELVLARRNTARLLANGGVETGAGHYPLIVGLHAAWLIGLFILAWDQPVNWIWMAVFVLLQLARVWVIASLGGRWTTRIITVPGETLVRRGPYRFISHPNYLVVAAEIAVLPLAFGLFGYAAVFSILNAIVLTIRIMAESRALSESGTPAV